MTTRKIVFSFVAIGYFMVNLIIAMSFQSPIQNYDIDRISSLSERVRGTEVRIDGMEKQINGISETQGLILSGQAEMREGFKIAQWMGGTVIALFAWLFGGDKIRNAARSALRKVAST